ncbi:hypothetical protein [Flagellimonas flava]|uniref:Uncharacterized protein n=1 Tax=Flagellimonas flava TaxID=570519 RepID=A0A1M5IM94_9FLAO|nr:hypothetical protein [Allomuricauda flava]SHG29422.1 hypothetical protein SAMN04488116_0805 [Allomuricauda flava]
MKSLTAPNLSVLTLLVFVFFLKNAYAQDQRFTGTFLSEDQKLTAQVKYEDGQYQGVVNSGGNLFAFRGEMEGEVIKGELFAGSSAIPYVTSAIAGGISVKAQGNTIVYHQTSQQHELANVDLKPYFVLSGTGGSADNHSVSMDGGSYPELTGYIAGSQLVYYQRSSLVLDDTASSLTYVNFCGDGTFNVSKEASYSVEGRYGGNAHGASNGAYVGTWKVEQIQGTPSLIVNFANGQYNSYPINMGYLNAGRWRIGNTQYAIQRHKAICR